MNLMGGPAAYESLLDEMFEGTSETTGRSQPDITGMIGQYAHGNEPSHHMAYLYAYAGNHGKTAKLVKQIQENLYSNDPDGLSGNEDCGQMSAWHVWSAMGMYPVCPGSDQLVVGAPAFSSMLITPRPKRGTFSEKNELHIERLGSGSYISGIASDFGHPTVLQSQTKSWFSKELVRQGGRIQFETDTDSPGTFGSALADRPSEIWDDKKFIGVPVISAPMTFRSKTFQVSILPNAKNDAIEYQTSPRSLKQASESWKSYSGPFEVSADAQIWARSVGSNGNQSSAVSHHIRRISHNWTLNLQTAFDPQYAASGRNAMIDGIRGPRHYQTGDWQGFWGEDVKGVIDLKENRQITAVEVGALRDIRPWIFLPREVRIEVSSDSLAWRAFGKGPKRHENANDDEEALVHRFEVEGEASARYIRFDIINFGPLPEGHLGAGHPSWTFLDEIHVITK